MNVIEAKYLCAIIWNISLNIIKKHAHDMKQDTDLTHET